MFHIFLNIFDIFIYMFDMLIDISIYLLICIYIYREREINVKEPVKTISNIQNMSTHIKNIKNLLNTVKTTEI